MDPETTLIPVADPLLPVRPSTLRRIFIGKDGMRAGWSILIFISTFAVIGFCVRLIGHKLHAPDPAAGSEISPTAEFVNFFATLLVTWIMSRIERRPISVYGFGDSRKVPHFLAGLAWGCTCLSLLILTLWKTGLLIIDRRLLSGSAIFRYGALWLVGFLLLGLAEEYFTRGYLQYTLTRGLAGLYSRVLNARYATAFGFWTSAVIFSILFGLGHKNNPGESPIGLIAAGFVGLVFCFSLWRTGSLWWAIGFHTSWDWAQSYLYGVADSGLTIQHHLLATHPVGKPILSGGTTGPEGSIFVVAVLLMVTIIIVLTLPPRHWGKSRGSLLAAPR